MARHAENARERIVDAAEDVVIEVGARHLTLDTVAAKAGVSKGGLLYHFPNKKALLHAMLERRITRLERIRQEKLASLPEDPRSPIVAYVLSLQEEDQEARNVSVALFAAVAHDPQLLLPFQKEFGRQLDEFCRGGLSFERAAVVMLAVNGLKLLELFSLLSFTAEERNRIIEKIIALAKEETHQ